MSRTSVALAVALVCGLVTISVTPGEAHKPITSPYTYNDDIFPLVRDKCGRCHVSGGIAPMSLMSHTDAVPWGESIRTELLAGHMPPGGLDGGAARFRNVSTLSPREMNTLLTWVTGGTPIGSPEKTPPPMSYQEGWRLGPPDLTLAFPDEVTIPADVRERTVEFTIPAGLAERSGIRAIDVKPGNPAIVRAATISVRGAMESATLDMAAIEQLVALWLPGEDPIALDEGLGFDLPAQTDLVVRVLYRKTWEYERKEMRDRSTIGVYLARKPSTIVRTFTLSQGLRPPFDVKTPSFRRTIPQDVRALSVYATGSVDGTRVNVTATRPDGSRVELIALRTSPDWARRYWFKVPIVLPRGTIVDVTTAIDDEPALPALSVAPTSPSVADPLPLGLRLNVVPGR